MKFFADECCDAGIVASLRNVIENNRVLMEKNKSKHFSTYEEAAEGLIVMTWPILKINYWPTKCLKKDCEN